MRQILTLTLNPALDLATTVPRVEAGPKLRCTAPSAEPGGGGVNVSRAIAHLGGTSRAVLALGGPVGQQMAALMAAQGIDVLAVPAPGETRMSFAVTDKFGDQFRFVLPGPVWGDADMARVLEQLQAEAAQDALVVLSGSVPPGVPDDIVARLCAALGPGRTVIADTSGKALDHVADHGKSGLAVLRMDSAEAEDLSGQGLPDRADTAWFADRLRQRGCATRVIVARGADGSVMAGPEGIFHVTAVPVPIRSKIGAGDSFVGAFALSLARGDLPTEALRHGAAAASAAVMTDGTELCRAGDVATLLARTEVTPLDA